MRKILQTIALVASVGTTAGCATLATKADAAIQKVTDTYRGTNDLIKAVGNSCETIARRCAAANDPVCRPLDFCGNLYVELNKVLAAIEVGILRAHNAIRLGEEVRGLQVLEDVQKLFQGWTKLSNIYRQFIEDLRSWAPTPAKDNEGKATQWAM